MSIIFIDKLIKERFDKDKYYYDDLETTLKNESLSNLQRKKINVILERKNDFLFYLSQTSDIVEKERKKLSIPLQIDFLKFSKLDIKFVDNNINNYLTIAQKYTDIDLKQYKNNEIKFTDNLCENCDADEEMVLEGTFLVCMSCGNSISCLSTDSTYSDNSRINYNKRCEYSKYINFRNCVSKYQGLQTTTIPDEIYNGLNIYFRKNKEVNITKDTIRSFLKANKYQIYYDDINLIFTNLTGYELDDISYLEDQLLEDFDLFSTWFDSDYKPTKDNRKNFINSHYILYQLLRRHNHVPDLIVNIKTASCRTFHDTVTKIFFNKMNWRFKPLF
jgi:hypothetical protein